ncbi:MAG: T9SS type A sorting domain-containing protein [Adhaeribacter sp.]
MEQIRNGSASSPVNPAQWQNGNAGNQTAHYAEGHSIGYRALLTGLPVGETVTLTLGYDITHSSKNAIDFLTHYDRLQPHGQFFHTQEVVNPTLGTSFANGATTPTTIEIPRPYNGNPTPAGDAYDDIAADKRVMTMWGGNLTGIAYVSPFANTSLAQAEQRLTVTFEVTSASAVLAWGGHIASRLDWGFTTGGVPLSAGGISGSPYHMRLIGWTLSNLGQQDRSLSAQAVVPPPGCALTGTAAVCANPINGTTTYQYATTEVADTYNWTLTNSGGANAFFDPPPSTTSNNVTVNPGTNAGSYTVQLVTVRGGISSTEPCQFTTTVTKTEVPDVAYHAPACDQTTFSITVGSTAKPIIAGAQYIVRDKNDALITTLKVNDVAVSNPYTAPSPAPATITFTNINAGSGFKVSVSINGCSSSAFACPVVASTSGIQPLRTSKAPETNLVSSEEAKMEAYPVPFSDQTTLEFKSIKGEDYVINLYDLAGNLVKQLKSGKTKAGEITKVEVDGRGMAESIYLVRKVSKSGVSTVKLLKKE